MRTGIDQKNMKQTQPEAVDGEAAKRESEIQTAAAVLSTQGPCRQVGDVYLACVATAGK